ncbi:MAG: tetratricopeptide repeat protein, partial [Bacteroidetes bacterium]
MKTIVLYYIFWIVSCSLYAQSSWEHLCKQADSLNSISDYKGALLLCEKAISIVEKETGKNNESYIKCRNSLGKAMTFVYKNDQTEAFLKETEELAKKVVGKKHPAYAASLNILGGWNYIKRNYSVSESF